MSGEPPAVPTATYRLQLRPEFGFAQAAQVVDYLAALGVSHLYLSPVFEAAPGSPHGYDVTDPTRLRAELGGESGWARLTAACRAAGLRIVVDIVPNHLGVAPGAGNPWWRHVLRHGRASRHAAVFDIDWDAAGDRVVLPVLAGRLEPGELELLPAESDAGGEPELGYRGLRLPIDPVSAGPGGAGPSGAGPSGAGPGTLLSRQHYVLVEPGAGAPPTQRPEVNYRRFFDVNDLAGVRVEDPEVFATTHALVARLTGAPEVAGLRVDHPDGLADPLGYLQRLRALAPHAWIVVEKILAVDEQLPPDWPVAGTTGYDALADVEAVFTDAAGAPALRALLAQQTGERRSFAEVAHAARREVARTTLAPEMHRLDRLAARALPGRAAGARQDALLELTAALGVYRTYLRPFAAPGADGATDRAADGATGVPAGGDAGRVFAEALALARRTRPELAGVLGELGQLLRHPETAVARELTVRWQQTTVAVAAKGVEDTAFYRYPLLVSLNEVGGDPGRVGMSLEEFHARAAARQRHHPSGMVALSTHDTKRGEDARARLSLLAELPERWAATVAALRAAATLHRGPAGPDPTMEYLLAQSFLGAWPVSRDRALAYARKAAREAKVHTSWATPDPGYESALERFVTGVLDDPGYTGALDALLAELAASWPAAALARRLVALSMPGVPDVYQGAELWETSMVDPDNRRLVDFAHRARLLARLDGRLDGPPPAAAGAAAARPAATNEATKLLVVHRALQLRRAHPEYFGPGADYQPLAARGESAEHVLAFARAPGGRAEVVTVAPRFPARLAASGGWGGTTLDLPDGSWSDVLSPTGSHRARVPMAELLGACPVALLVREG